MPEIGRAVLGGERRAVLTKGRVGGEQQRGTWCSLHVRPAHRLAQIENHAGQYSVGGACCHAGTYRMLHSLERVGGGMCSGAGPASVSRRLPICCPHRQLEEESETVYYRMVLEGQSWC